MAITCHVLEPLLQRRFPRGALGVMAVRAHRPGIAATGGRVGGAACSAREGLCGGGRQYLDVVSVSAVSSLVISDSSQSEDRA